MANTDDKLYYCEKCKKTMRADQFYGSNNAEKYPEGKLTQCKQCITMHVDNWNADTYLWILQECDVPYIQDEWSKLLTSYAKDPSKVTGMTILGRYLSKMKLKQWRDYRWKDTEFLQEVANNKTEQVMKRQGYDAQEIAQVLAGQQLKIPEGGFVEPVHVEVEAPRPPDEDYFAIQSGGADDDVAIENDLTEEDRIHLRLKWGKSYKPEEWVKLEQLYEEMMASYDIQSAGHIDTLKLVCKCSLKANQLLDIGDIDGAQKMIKMYDGLMKAGKFTAAQNKAETGEFVNCISELVTICEREGFIPRFYTDGPQDRVDETLMDLKNYSRTLVIEEMNLGNLIENAVKEMAREEAKEEDEDIEEELNYEELSSLKDEDYEEYLDFIEEQERENEEIFKSFEKEEE